MLPQNHIHVCGDWLPTLIPRSHSSLPTGPKWPLCPTPPVNRRCTAVGVCSCDACGPTGLHWSPESRTSTIDRLSFGPRIFWWNPHDRDITAGSRHNSLCKQLVWPLTGGLFHNCRNAKAVSSSYSLEGDQRCRFTATTRRPTGNAGSKKHDLLGLGKLDTPPGWEPGVRPRKAPHWSDDKKSTPNGTLERVCDAP
mgnify:CR=1 FL=1